MGEGGGGRGVEGSGEKGAGVITDQGMGYLRKIFFLKIKRKKTTTKKKTKNKTTTTTTLTL